MDNKHEGPIWFKGTMPPDWVTRFTVGEDYQWDTLLLPYDIEATAAHVKGLVRAGIMSEPESVQVEHALDKLVTAWKAGQISVSIRDEDGHTVIERVLVEELGDTGKKVHTARSRNDQVLAAIRLWMRDQIDDIATHTADAAEKLLVIAQTEAETFLPGYTHMQRAMPSSVGLWAAGFAESLADDLDFLGEARDHVNVSPLGSAAGYGVPHVALDRAYVADLLGFDRVQENVTSVQLSRGKLELGIVHALVQLAATFNRLAADVVLYSSAEFGFFRLADELTTGSSIMPQKKNPDVAELARAAVHRITAEAHVLLSVPANLPSGYHRDLQLTKEAAMRAVIAASNLAAAMNHLVVGLTFDREKMASARTPDLYATAAAMLRVGRGEPFREAYRAAAENPQEWAEAMDSSLESTYLYDGTPGRPVIASVRARLNKARHS